MFRHPKYYKELRKRNKALRSCDAYSKENSNYTERQQSDQAISQSKTVDVGDSVRPCPGSKRQASSTKLFKILDASFKLQAASYKLQDLRTTKKFHVA